MYGLHSEGPQPRLALGNRSLNTASVNQLSIPDLGLFRGSVGVLHEDGGALPNFCHSGQSKHPASSVARIAEVAASLQARAWHLEAQACPSWASLASSSQAFSSLALRVQPASCPWSCHPCPAERNRPCLTRNRKTRSDR